MRCICFNFLRGWGRDITLEKRCNFLGNNSTCSIKSLGSSFQALGCSSFNIILRHDYGVLLVLKVLGREIKYPGIQTHSTTKYSRLISKGDKKIL